MKKLNNKLIINIVIILFVAFIVVPIVLNLLGYNNIMEGMTPQETASNAIIEADAIAITKEQKAQTDEIAAVTAETLAAKTDSTAAQRLDATTKKTTAINSKKEAHQARLVVFQKISQEKRLITEINKIIKSENSNANPSPRPPRP